jgi:hypothetical protein
MTQACLNLYIYLGQPPDVLRQRAEESARLALEKLESQRAGEPLSPPPQVDVVLLSPTGPLAKQGQSCVDDHVPILHANGSTVIQEQSDAALVAIKASGFAKKRLWVRCAPGIYVHDCFWRGHAIIRALNHKVDRTYQDFTSSAMAGSLHAHRQKCL